MLQELTQTEKTLELLALSKDPMGRQVAQTAKLLFSHRVFSMVKTLQDAKVFMGYHVWAVWDFMSLVKALQQAVTCTSVPWVPPADANLAAFINEIVTGEESDITPGKDHASHYELYIAAMREVGADTKPIEDFISLLRKGETPEIALKQVYAPEAVQRFVNTTLNLAAGPQHLCAAAFCLSREELIPGMFLTLLNDLPAEQTRFATFRWYLERHVEVDGERHGPLSARLFQSLVGNDPHQLEDALKASLDALEARHELLEAAAVAIEKNCRRLHDEQETSDEISTMGSVRS